MTYMSMSNTFLALVQNLGGSSVNNSSNSRAKDIEEFSEGFFSALNITLNQTERLFCFNDLVDVFQNLSDSFEEFVQDDDEEGFYDFAEAIESLPETTENCLNLFSISVKDVEIFIKTLILDPTIIFHNIDINQFVIIKYLQQAYLAYYSQNFRSMGNDIGNALDLIFEIDQ